MPVILLILAVAGMALWTPSGAQPTDDLTAKQMQMLAAEVQFFSALARQQKDELDKLKATPAPCPESKP